MLASLCRLFSLKRMKGVLNCLLVMQFDSYLGKGFLQRCRNMEERDHNKEGAVNFLLIWNFHVTALGWSVCLFLSPYRKLLGGLHLTVSRILESFMLVKFFFECANVFLLIAAQNNGSEEAPYKLLPTGPTYENRVNLNEQKPLEVTR